MASTPRITARSTWRAAKAIPSGRGVPLSSRRFFTLHYPVMSDRPNHQWARDIERMHLNQGWAIIGYNYIVSNRDGEIMEGAGLNVRGIHSPPRNVDGFGVCVLQPSTPQGALTAPLSAAARTSTRQLYEWLCGRTGRRLQPSWHGQHFATACAGADLNAWARAGMPALPPPSTVPPPQTPPPPPQENDLVGMGLNAGGILHQFRIFQGAVWYRFRNRDGWTDWTRFAPLPDPSATLLSVAPGPDIAGAFNVALDSNRDGRSWRTWQPRNTSQWEGGQKDRQIAVFQAVGRIPA